MKGFPQTSGQKNKKRRGNKFLQQQIVDTLSMLLGFYVSRLDHQNIYVETQIQPACIFGSVVDKTKKKSKKTT
uniref:Uncharacterized protein n=1 Tax=Salix viminalis TaxID=40686 RepID=A0A6N2N152_SALVM